MRSPRATPRYTPSCATPHSTDLPSAILRVRQHIGEDVIARRFARLDAPLRAGFGVEGRRAVGCNDLHRRAGAARCGAREHHPLRVSITAHREFGRLARSEEHTSELQSLMRISYAVFCLKKKKQK